MFKINRQYIYPTADGIKLFAVNFILLITGILYQSNFLLIFNFALFSLVLCTMLYTHYHLKGITLIGSEILSKSAQESASMVFLLKNNTPLLKNKINIYLKEKKEKSLHPIEENFDIKPFKVKKIIINSFQKKRGQKNFNLFISTSYPLFFFKTFIPVEKIKLSVYPERKNHPELVTKKVSFHTKKNASDDLIIDNYTTGDSPSRILWKKSDQELYVRKGSSDLSRDQYLIKISSPKDLKIEEKLEAASFLLQNLKGEQSINLSIENEKYHFSKASPKQEILKKIATYGLS